MATGVTIDVKHIDRGWKRLVRAALANKAHVTIGVHADAEPYVSSTGKKTEVTEVAYWHEYGTSRMPARSWLRSTAEAKRTEIDAFMLKGQIDIIAGRTTTEKALGRIGFKVMTWMQNRIKTNKIKPVTGPAQLAKKKKAGLHYATLYETGHLQRSITFKVKDGIAP